MQTRKELQLHLLVGCADARDLSQIEIDAIALTIEDFRKEGIEVEVHTIRAAGSFITPDVVMDIKRTFEEAQRSNNENLPMRFFVHIQTHGHLTEDSQENYISHVHDLHVVPDSPLNCGMLSATHVAIELEQMIVTEQPEIIVRGKRMKITNDTEIKQMLREIYAYNGYLAGDWITSIDALRTHPRHQRTVLERAISVDPELKVLNIEITCGIRDYAIHSLIRVDDGEPAVPFWDTVQQEIRNQSENDRTAKELLINQSKKQRPYAGLLSMSHPKQSSRTHAARYYMQLKGIAYDDYLPNTIFNMSGTSFDIPSTPFGPYVIAGFYFSVKHLALKDQMVMGYDQHQTSRMIQKIENDPIMSMIVRKFNVNLIPLNLVDME